MRLNELCDNPGAVKPKKRIGRGIGSGKGKTAGRGVKGQKSRSGVAIKGYEGGQMPIYMRLPKRGFNKPNRKKYAEVSIRRLEQAIEAGVLDLKKPVDAAALVAAGVIRRPHDGVRVIGTGKLSKPVKLVVNYASAGATKIIEKAKGSVEITDAKPVKPAKVEKPKAKKAAEAKPAKKPAAKKPAQKTEAKKSDKLDAYVEMVRKYDKKADAEIIAKIVKLCGPAMNTRDGKYIACTDDKERKTVAKSWLEKRLGLKGSAEELDVKVKAVCEQMKKDRLKNRVVFYYLLAKNEDKLADL